MMYSNNIVNFQESTTVLNVGTKKSGNLLNSPRMFTQDLALNNLLMTLKRLNQQTIVYVCMYRSIYLSICKHTQSLLIL